MTPQEILNVKKPELIFPFGELDDIKHRYRDYARAFHPDKNPAHGDVFAHINFLHDEALKKVTEGTWGGRGVTVFKLVGGSEFIIQQLAVRPFGLGRMFIEPERVVFVIDSTHSSLVNNYSKIVSKLTFADDKMKKSLQASLPPSRASIEKTTDGQFLVSIKKPRNSLLLRDVLDYFGGRLPGRHMAWVTSTLHNLACYLSYAGVAHNDISPDTYFIDPIEHTGTLVGGWWWSAALGGPLTHVPARTAAVIPWEVKRTKTASHLTDLELIRLTGREIYSHDKTNHPIILKRLATVASGTAVEDYAGWRKTLDELGKRKYVVLEVLEEQLYGGA